MDDEKNYYEIWLDEYQKTMADEGLAVGDITIDLNDYYSSSSDYIYTIDTDSHNWVYPTPNTQDNITLTGGGEEMLRVDRDGFYVRGVRVEADAKEAEEVYRAFKQWLAWASLSRNDEE